MYDLLHLYKPNRGKLQYPFANLPFLSYHSNRISNGCGLSKTITISAGCETSDIIQYHQVKIIYLLFYWLSAFGELRRSIPVDGFKLIPREILRPFKRDIEETYRRVKFPRFNVKLPFGTAFG